MDIRFLFLILFAFVFEIFFLSKNLSFKDSKISQNDIEIEFTHSKTYDINSKKVKSVLICDKIQQRKKSKLFFKPIATIYDGNITKTIIADRAIYDDKTGLITLNKNIKIIYSDKKLSTDMLKYDTKKEIVIDSDDFTLISEYIVANGKHLYFDIKNNIIKAKDIKYNYKELP